MPIIRADGINESERYLKQLCDRTFLSLWSYSGIYSNEGLNKNKQGKEVCDLLAIFENNIIIFSDKDCGFTDSGDLEVDWNRWFKKSIQKSAQQLWGAEKWIAKHPNCLFLDNLCNQPFPLYIPDLESAKFHLISVAHSSSDRCRQELGGSGSLKIEIAKDKAQSKAVKGATSPFQIGDLDPNRTFVHILDDLSLDSVLKTLDTVSDFVAYLSKKEALCRSGCDISVASELELLAYYHQFINEEGERDFFIPKDSNGGKSQLFLPEGLWDKFEQSPERKAKLQQDMISYEWDALIERASLYCLSEKLKHTSHSTIAEQEILLRYLARENRLHRRILAQTLYELVYSAPTDGTVTVRYLPHPSSEKLVYIFMVFPHLEGVSYEEYRYQRRENLRLRCLVAKIRKPDAQHFIGLATETKLLREEGRSEDFIHMDLTEWTSEDEVQAIEIERDLCLSRDLKIFKSSHQDYPTM